MMTNVGVIDRALRLAIAFGLLGATWVNQAVLLMAFVLLVWTTKTLLAQMSVAPARTRGWRAA